MRKIAIIVYSLLTLGPVGPLGRFAPKSASHLDLSSSSRTARLFELRYDQGLRPRMDDLLWTKRSWSGSTAYAESKFYDVALAFAISAHWKNVLSNALEPGWVPIIRS
jgi:hypothetical protein